MSTLPNMLNCPVCGATAVDCFARFPHVPVHCNLLWENRAAAQAAPRGEIALHFCHRCGHIFNAAFDPALMSYDQAYENSLHFSPRFQQYAEGLAQGLVERHDLHDKDIVEIGAGQGDFLRMVCDLGPNRGWGFDPAYVPTEADARQPHLTFVQDFYGEKYTGYSADLIACRHVLEHIEEPLPFMRVVRRTVGDRPETVVFFEVPNAAYTLRELAIWDIIYEHYSYFSAPSLTCLFARAGFRTLRTDETFAGQFLTIEAVTAAEADDNACRPGETIARMEEQVASFGKALEEKIALWQHKLRTWQSAGQKVVAWGAGSKGVTFLNVLDPADQIQYIVDINPRKEGKFVVGSGQQIVPPALMQDYRPDVVILMNPVYQQEIAQTLAGMNLHPHFEIA